MASLINLSQVAKKAQIQTRHVRQLSSKLKLKDDNENKNAPRNPQAFVKVRLTPGEGDPLSKFRGHAHRKADPTYRPRWRHKANIISKEDFAARPTVGFDTQFDSLHDAAVVLSWLNETQRQDVYQMYLSMMVDQDNEFKGTTSHEYVMRVIAEKFHLSPRRVGAIVQNCHDEEQAYRNGEISKDQEKVSAWVDTKIQELIDDTYETYEEKNPNEFVEPPIGGADMINVSPARDAVTVEDLYDVEELEQEAVVREREEAQLLIDQKVYIEDVHAKDITSKANAECHKLIKRANIEFKDLRNSFKRSDGSDNSSDNGAENDYEYTLPEGGQREDEEGNITKTERRERWKWVAQTVNTREEKNVRKMKKGGRRKGTLRKKNNDNKDNTLVEHDGVLRVATMEEVSGVAWKPIRNPIEHTYGGVKASWLSRKHDRKGWGRMERKYVEEEEENAEEEVEKSEGDAEVASADVDANGGGDKK
mmetsp:Transcript_9604/g.14384  ORF Transcript_9604/g.14384 Transcript_9604/m.14384 type:complete len:477 (+) Transcript_9604:143-1573(+)